MKCPVSFCRNLTDAHVLTHLYLYIGKIGLILDYQQLRKVQTLHSRFEMVRRKAGINHHHGNVGMPQKLLNSCEEVLALDRNCRSVQ